MTKVTLFPYL